MFHEITKGFNIGLNKYFQRKIVNIFLPIILANVLGAQTDPLIDF